MSRVSLVVSDVDGTLVTTDKVLTERSRAAVAQLDDAGIGFSIISSRPPFGLRMLIELLTLRLPVGAFNGATLVAPNLSVIEQRTLSRRTAREAIALFHSISVASWAFTGDRWLVEDAKGAYVEREIRTVRAQPTIVEHLEDHLDGVVKLVGVSEDFARLASYESIARQALGEGASVARSQSYYLDITPAGTDKGILLTALAQQLGVPTHEIVTIGDMENDVAMFRHSGFGIAMGNASAEVKRVANAVTLSNDEDGFAAAVERVILPRARQSLAAL